MTVEVIVSGAGGRLGRSIVTQCAREPDIAVRAVVVRPGSSLEGQDANVFADELADSGLRVTSRLALDRPAVLIETAPPSAAARHAEEAAAAGLPVVMATTGWGAAEIEGFRRLADAVPFLLAPNLSLGVNVLLDLVARASSALAEYDLEVVELHHRRKRDAPSGTATALASKACTARGRSFESDAIMARAGNIGPRSTHEVGVFAVRGGDIIGEHTVYFIGDTERIELTHRAATRDAFAHGATVAARYLFGREPGWYTMRDVLGLERASGAGRP